MIRTTTHQPPIRTIQWLIQTSMSQSKTSCNPCRGSPTRLPTIFVLLSEDEAALISRRRQATQRLGVRNHCQLLTPPTNHFRSRQQSGQGQTLPLARDEQLSELNPRTMSLLYPGEPGDRRRGPLQVTAAQTRRRRQAERHVSLSRMSASLDPAVG